MRSERFVVMQNTNPTRTASPHQHTVRLRFVSSTDAIHVRVASALLVLAIFLLALHAQSTKFYAHAHTFLANRALLETCRDFSATTMRGRTEHGANSLQMRNAFARSIVMRCGGQCRAESLDCHAIWKFRDVPLAMTAIL
eukprot:6177279-Pleurochrysis_carterae.AAC.1